MGQLLDGIPLPSDLGERRAVAWIGDAVLSLYVRSWILRQRGAMDGELFSRVTSNEFLLRFGNPTSVEAAIGILYQRDGLDSAWQWLDHHFANYLERELASRSPARR